MPSDAVIVVLLPVGAALLLFSLVRILVFRRYSVLNLLVFTTGVAGLLTSLLALP